MDTFDGIRALVVGMAREGTALARFLAQGGAQVTVTDVKEADALADRLAALQDLPIELALGGHPVALLDGTEIVFVSPGVPLDIPLLAEARRRGLPLSSETRLFTRLCPAPIVGITGSSGKTTTTALTGEMLDTSGRRTWVGGNIGQPLIGHLGEITATDTVVMELSSFQLDFFGPWPSSVGGRRIDEPEAAALFDPAGWSPPIGAILNITPNHLDRHPTMEAYVAAKRQILAHQRPGDVAVLGLDNAVARQLGEDLAAVRRPSASSGSRPVLWFSMEQEVEAGAFLRGQEMVLRLPGVDAVVCRTDDVRLLGQHNVANTLAAFALAGAAGAPVNALRRVATTFRGVAHRLELVLERDGVRWYNDSIATSPERTVAALRAFEDPIVLLAGGRDKHLPWDEMAAVTRRKVRHLLLFGEAANQIESSLRAAGEPQVLPVHRVGTLEAAVALAADLVQPGDVVLLSPGGTSFDAYQDFVARGNHFRELVLALE